MVSGQNNPCNQSSQMQYIPQNIHMAVLCLVLFCLHYQIVVDSCNSFTHILQSYLTDNEEIIWVLLRQWIDQIYMSKSKQCLITMENNKAPTMCTFLGTYSKARYTLQGDAAIIMKSTSNYLTAFEIPIMRIYHYTTVATWLILYGTCYQSVTQGFVVEKFNFQPINIIKKNR